MSLVFYPAVLDVAEDGTVGVVFPDLLGCVSVGGDAQEAASNAAEALSLHLEGMREDGEEPPPPSPITAPLPDWLEAGRESGRVLVPVLLDGPEVRVSLDADGLARLDRLAAERGATRDGAASDLVRRALGAA